MRLSRDERISQGSKASAIFVVVALSVLGAWAVATWLSIVPLGNTVGPFIVRHLWIVGMASSIVAFVPITGIWLVARRLFSGSRSVGAA